MEALKNLDWHELLEKLAHFATSEQAREKLRQTSPLASQSAAATSVLQIQDLQIVVRQGTRPHMQSLDLFTAWFQRLSRQAVLKTLELRDVRHFCIECLALKEALKLYSEDYTQKLFHQLMPAQEPLSAIDQIMTPGGDIRMDASEKLHNLNIEKTGLGRQIHGVLDRLVKAHQLETLLQDRFVTTREGRWVLPIKSGMQHGFQGIVHAASQSKQTVFMEPQEAVPLNNRLREVEVEIEQEVERLLTELSQYLATLVSDFQQSQKTMLEADIKLAQAQLAVQIDAKNFHFSENEIQLVGVRHPLLVLSGHKVVANTVELSLQNKKQILLLSGPNAGGKTVLMKSIGLAAQMARCGLPICADPTSKIIFFKKLVVALGDAQSVDAHLSTFAAHLQLLNNAAKAQGPDNLILIDEICGSTDPEEGAALARSFIQAYAQNQTFAIITSHLGALKRGWEDSSVVSGSLQFEPQKGPTYRFILGVPGQSLAIQTAQRVGVDAQIIENAIKNLTPEVREYQKALTEIDSMKGEILKLQDRLKADLAGAQQDKIKYQKLIDQFTVEKESLLEKEALAARKKVDEFIQETKAKEVFKRHETFQKIKFDLPEVIKSPTASTKLSPTLTTADDFAANFPPGTSVFISSLNRDGIVQGRPNAKDEVPVLSSSMRLMVHWRDLKPSRTNQNPTQNLIRKSAHYAHGQNVEDRVIDVRGLTVEEAISQIELQLDTASLAGEDRVKLIHGHGTEVLKRKIRSYLSRSVYVKKWSAGTAESGGDGLTWVELKET